MEVLPVDDPTDPRLADYADLRHRRVDPTGPVVVEGLLAIGELAASPYLVRSVLVAPNKLDRLPALPPGTPVYLADVDVQRATVGFDFHRGAVAAADRIPLPDPTALLDGRTVLVAERLNDLENLGSLFRNARAFGVGAVLLDAETTDPLHRRVVRVSMGHALRIPFARLPQWPPVLPGYELAALTPAGSPLADWAPTRPTAFLVGAEGPGLTDAALAAADVRLRIPMAPEVDSVNVATAAAIALSWRFGLN